MVHFVTEVPLNDVTLDYKLKGQIKESTYFALFIILNFITLASKISEKCSGIFKYSLSAGVKFLSMFLTFPIYLFVRFVSSGKNICDNVGGVVGSFGFNK